MSVPYYSDKLVTLYHGDFRDVLPVLDIQPDLVVTDPPYGETSLDWDRWPDGWPSLIPGRSMWCFGSMRMFLDRRNEFSGWQLSQDVVWEKHNGSGFHTDRFRRIHEHALHWYKGSWDDIRRDTPLVGEERPRQRISRGKTPHIGSGGADGLIQGKRLMSSVIYAPSMHGTAINETEKPRGIVEPLIEYGCPTGGLVLDIFAGSCSTLVAARATVRRAIGIELREEQCEKAVRYRLSQGLLPFGEAS